MPIVPNVGASSPLVVPVPVSPGQKVAPIEPARRVTAVKANTRSEIDPDEKRRHQHSDHSGDRGATLDLEV